MRKSNQHLLARLPSKMSHKKQTTKKGGVKQPGLWNKHKQRHHPRQVPAIADRLAALPHNHSMPNVRDTAAFVLAVNSAPVNCRSSSMSGVPSGATLRLPAIIPPPCACPGVHTADASQSSSDSKNGTSKSNCLLRLSSKPVKQPMWTSTADDDAPPMPWN